MVEVVTQIKTAESQSEDICRAARHKVKQLVEEAVASAKEAADTQRQKAVAQSADILAKAEKDAATYLEESSAQSKAACEELRESAEKCMEKAATFIVERIVQSL